MKPKDKRKQELIAEELRQNSNPVMEYINDIVGRYKGSQVESDVNQLSKNVRSALPFLDKPIGQATPEDYVNSGMVGSISTKFPMANRLNPLEYKAMKVTDDPLTHAVHTIRGNTGYLAAVDDEVSRAGVSTMGRLLKKLDEGDEDALDDLLDYNLGQKQMESLMQPSKVVLDKPMYVKRQEGYLVPKGETPAHHTHSAEVIDPLDVDSYEFPYNTGNDSGNIYRIDPGAEVYHTLGRADRNEVLLHRGTLNEAKQMAVADYLKLLAKGAAPFGVAGLAVGQNNDRNRGD